MTKMQILLDNFENKSKFQTGGGDDHFSVLLSLHEKGRIWKSCP